MKDKHELIRAMYPTARQSDIDMLIYQAERLGLDPLCRQIHLVVRGRGATVQVGIDGYRAVADRTGAYAGNDDPVYDEGLSQAQMLAQGRRQPQTATVTVHRIVAGIRCPFTATAMWDAYAPRGDEGFMWKKMPFLMLGKCAEALALRKAFPAELSGVYTDEEMEQVGTVTDEQSRHDVHAANASTGQQQPDKKPDQKDKKQESHPSPDDALAAVGQCQTVDEVNAWWRGYREAHAQNSELLNAGLRAKADRIRALKEAK
jgi:phage recombination protein Bet